MEHYSNKLNLIGQRFGKLVVVREEPRSITGEPRWYCKCDCGGTVITTTHNLRSTKKGTKSCGCLHAELKMRDLTNMKFGRLTVLRPAGLNFRGSRLWTCRCSCGNEVTLPSSVIISGNTRSCGCLARDITRQNTIERNTKYFDEDSLILSRRFLGMKSRCYNTSNPAYCNYGARGITICDEWLGDTLKFISWAKSHGFRRELSLDRIDVNKGYSPENCRWATPLIQSNNRRNNRVFRIRELTQSVARWIESLDLPKYYHKELYSEPDHVIKSILMKKFTDIIRTLHLENVRKAADILKYYAEYRNANK